MSKRRLHWTRGAAREAARLDRIAEKLPSVFDQADRLGEMVEPRAKTIERPVKLWQTAVPLRRGWADCPICSRDVNACGCDPDAYQAAVIARDFPHLLKGERA